MMVSCNSSEKKTEQKVSTEKEKFVPDMYQASEMTLMMRSMYTSHEEIKKNILEGVSPKEFPSEYLNIYTAKLTDNKPQSEIFKSFSKIFIENEKDIYNAASKIPVKERFNIAVNTCISCHTTECVGPIPRIKKLLIHY